MIRAGMPWLLGAVVLTVAACRERPIDVVDTPDERITSLSLVHMIHQLDAEGNGSWSVQPATDAVVYQYGSETSAEISVEEDGVLALDETLDSVVISAHAVGLAPVYWFDVTPSASYLVLSVERIEPNRAVEKDEAQRFEGRVAGFSPSGLDETSHVDVYYRNSSGLVLSESLQKDSDFRAVGSGFSLLGNTLDFWLPAGDNELVALERILKESNASDFKMGRLMYTAVFPAQAAGRALTDQTFSLAVGPDGSVCPPYGEMKMSWPAMDRTFIRRKTGAVHVEFSLQMPGGLEIPLVDNTYFDDRIRTGNSLLFLNPYRIEGSLAGAQYLYRSGATRSTEYGADVREFKKRNAGTEPCAMPFASSLSLPDWSGVSVTDDTPFSLPAAVTGEEQELVFWAGPATHVPVFRAHGPIAPESDVPGHPILRVVRGPATVGPEHPAVASILAVLQKHERVTLQRTIAEGAARVKAWQQDPLEYVHTHGYAHTEVSARSDAWYQLLEWIPVP